MREEFTSIKIDFNGIWYAKNIPLVNKNVLFYFKNNLKRDKKGIYIENIFKDLKEKGYIVVEGPVLFITDINIKNKTCQTEINSVLDLKESEVVYYNNRIYLLLEGLNVWSVLNKSSTIQVLNEIKAEHENYFLWDDLKISTIPKIKWTQNGL